jgi:superfamily II RNA helicase
MLNQDILARFPYTLDTFQQKAAEGIENGDHVLVTAHTSAGKSTVAEYAIIKAFLDNKRVIYTSPIKTLSNQKFYEFKRKFVDFGENNIGIQTGDVKLNPDAQCTIMTTEILRNMLYKEGCMDDLGYVIFDEVHYINDKDRGHVWEECIMKLPSHVVMVMLSATMANPEDFAGWVRSIKPEKEVHIVSTMYRPVPLQFFAFVPNPGSFDESLPWEEAVRDGHMAQILDGEHGTFKASVYTQMTHRYKAYESRVFDDNINIKKAMAAAAVNKRQSYDMLAMLNKFLNFLHINRLVPSIFFTLSRKRCDFYADRVNVSMITHEERREVENIFDFHIRKMQNHDTYEQVRKMKEWLMKGVAVHHSGLFPILKEIVEILFSKGLVKVLFATETFAVGINMPTKTVVFLDVTKYTDGVMRPLYVEEFKQMAGRAGRRGLDKIGTVIYFPVHDMLGANDVQQMMLGRLKPIKSRFHVTPQYVLRSLKAGETIVDTTNLTMVQAEHTALVEGYVLQLQELQQRKQTANQKIEESDMGGRLRFVIAEVQELEHKANHGNKKMQKTYLRQAQDLKDNLSKQEQRVFESLKGLMTEVARLDADILSLQNDMESSPKLLEWDICKCKDYLEKYGYLNGDNVTIKGVFAGEITQCNEVILAEVFFRKMLDPYRDDPVNLATVLGMFLDDQDRVEDDPFQDIGDIVGQDMRKRLYDIQELGETMFDDLVRRGIHVPFQMNAKYVGPVYDWCQGEEHFETICKNYNIFIGNMVRAFQKLVNLLDEIRNGFEAIQDMDWVQAIDKTKELVARDLVVTDSIYLSM